MLSNPQKYIIDKGGKIFYAKYKNQIVGTVTLLKIDDYMFELSKMAVKEKFQGLEIGKNNDGILHRLRKRK
jgi:Acetyltransferase (GNAT) family